MESCRQKYPGLVILEPKFVFLTAFKTKSFVKMLNDMGVEECFEKPIQIEQLRYLTESIEE